MVSSRDYLGGQSHRRLLLRRPIRMPISHVIDRFRQRMFTQASGLVTLEDLNAHLDAEERERGLDLPELFDATGVSTNVTPAQIRQLVNRAHATLRKGPLGPTAIVVTDDVAFGMAQMYAILTRPLGIVVEVFRDVESAERWLASLTGATAAHRRDET